MSDVNESTPLKRRRFLFSYGVIGVFLLVIMLWTATFGAYIPPCGPGKAFFWATMGTSATLILLIFGFPVLISQHANIQPIQILLFLKAFSIPAVFFVVGGFLGVYLTQRKLQSLAATIGVLLLIGVASFVHPVNSCYMPMP